MIALTCTILGVAVAPVFALADARQGSGEVDNTSASLSAWMTQDFYHALVMPMLFVTVLLAWFARPSTKDERPHGFFKFQVFYLSVWCLCVAADWLQGPYVYALYAAYGFSKGEIAQLFVAGFGASLVFGCFVGTVADRFGRKRSCLAYCALYILSCMTKHVKLYSILMVGRITGGIATSMLFSCFECWMVSEHVQRHKFSGGLLGYMFGLMFSLMYCVAILSGLAAQGVADAFVLAPVSTNGLGSIIYVGGYVAPFDLAIMCLIVGMVMIMFMWEENYGRNTGADSEGDDSGGLWANIETSLRLLVKDSRVLLLCIIVAGFEGSMFAFVFNWTPALNSQTIPPPHGLIFALFMMACMCGASASTMASNATRPHHRLMGAFFIGMAAFAVAASIKGGDESLKLFLAAFLAFEFCVGVYFPSVGVLKSEIVPEAVRGTMYNIYRIPLNGVVVLLLLTDISMVSCFRLCGLLLLLSLIAMQRISACSVASASSIETSKEV